MDAVKGVATLLSGPVHEIVVVFVGERPERSRHVSPVDAMSLPHRVALRGGEWPGYLVIEAPCPAVFVVDWHPEVSMYRMVGTRRNHREGRHHPLGDAPVIVAVLGVAPGPDHKSAGTFDALEHRLAVSEIVRVALSPLERR